MKTMKNSSTFCVNPYINVSIHPSGVIKPCCMSHYKYHTDQLHQTLNQANILDFWNSKSRKFLIEKLENDIEVKECNACWNEERSGKLSKRLRDNATYADHSLDEPVVMDLSLGNTCNLKCRICSPTHSSQWMIEEADLQYPLKRQKYLKDSKWQISKESFDDSNELFWPNILEMVKNVKKIDLAGGEPFLIEKHWDLIKHCVNTNISKNIDIHYNTNGTIFPEKYIPLLEEFKTVDIQISSDGVERKFEYLRHPADWRVHQENIDRFISAKNNSKTNWMLSVCFSVSAFNVVDYFEAFEHYISKGIGFYTNVVHYPYSINSIPKGLRIKIVDYLNSCTSKFNDQLWQVEKNFICHKLINDHYDEAMWSKFINDIKLRDKIRNESFEDTFPEYWNMIKDYL